MIIISMTVVMVSMIVVVVMVMIIVIMFIVSMMAVAMVVTIMTVIPLLPPPALGLPPVVRAVRRRMMPITARAGGWRHHRERDQQTERYGARQQRPLDH